MSADAFASLTQAVAEHARKADVFESVTTNEQGLVCPARDAEAEALYKITQEDGKTWIGLYTADRWLSESIEADLLHSGDKMEELLDEELVELGYEKGGLAIEHFRDDAKVYVFRTKLPTDAADQVDTATKILLGYEACFRQLGDMSSTDELV